MKKDDKTIFSKEYKWLINQIVSIREKRSLTQRDLAKLINVPHSRIAMIELCQRRLDIIELINLLKALDVSKKETLDLIGKLI